MPSAPHPYLPQPGRRLLIGAAAALALPGWLTPARAAGRLTLTPSQAEGPFYPDALPADHDSDLLAVGARRTRGGEVLALRGTLLDPDGRPVDGALVDLWQCDAAGHYHHPRDGGRADPDFQGFGRARTARDGGFAFRTLRPAPYPGRTPHLHVKVWRGPRALLTTQLYVAGEPSNERDFLFRRLDEAGRAALTLSLQSGPDVWRGDARLIVAA